MHKATFLEGTISLTIAPEGPVLVKAGESGGADPTLPDMEFVRTRFGGREGKGQVYLPGSSLKGAVRAQCERICRSLDSAEQQQARQLRRRRELEAPDEPVVPLADNPLGTGRSYGGLDDMDYSSGRAIEAMDLRGRRDATAAIYRRSSLVSQIFGHTSLAGRVRFADAYPAGGVTIEERNGVAIDRIYGAVAVGPFNYETVVAGSFPTRIALKNITLAQLGLLGLALRDLAEGRIGLGFGKSRGLGRVSATLTALELSYPTARLGPGGELQTLRGETVAPAGHVAGVGAFCRGDDYRAYDFTPARGEGGDHAPVEGLAAREAPVPRDLDAIAKLDEGLYLGPDELLGVRLVARGEAAVRGVVRACMPAWRAEIGLV